MSFEISWTIEGEKQLSRVLTRLSTDIKNFKLPLTNIAEKLVQTFSTEVFSTQGAAIDESWRPLAPGTLQQKRRKGFSSQPLVATGTMQKSFRSIVTNDAAVIYNTADYFKYHQSNQPRKKLPRRVMMKIANRQKEMIVKEFKNYLRASANANV